MTGLTLHSPPPDGQPRALPPRQRRLKIKMGCGRCVGWGGTRGLRPGRGDDDGRVPCRGQDGPGRAALTGWESTGRLTPGVFCAG